MSLLEELNKRGNGTLPGLIGIEVLEAEKVRLASRLELRDELLAPNGYLATVERTSRIMVVPRPRAPGSRDPAAGS